MIKRKFGRSVLAITFLILMGLIHRTSIPPLKTPNVARPGLADYDPNKFAIRPGRMPTMETHAFKIYETGAPSVMKWEKV